jgi:NAD(P)-dependent dehydrogenase (short-subunit alcohol dehydrogenase family)
VGSCWSQQTVCYDPDYVATAIHVDVTDEDTVQKMVDYTLAEHGRIEYFVHSAGVSPLVPVIK